MLTEKSMLKPAGVIIKPGKDKSIRNRNPWVFSGAVERIEGLERNGQSCEIFSAQGDFLAVGYVNPDSKIISRVLAWERISPDYDFLEKRLRRALAFREHILDDRTNACRLVNSEGDFLPGLVVDRYGGGIVIQILTAGMEMWREELIDILERLAAPSFVVERSDTSSRREEGLEERIEVIKGTAPKPAVEILENGLRYKVDILRGQKTGFYLDQRDSRRRLGRYVSGKRVLNLFSYTGGFTAAAASSGASHVTSVDTSAPALELLKENMALNGLENIPGDVIRADVYRYLNTAEGSWDVIVLDPPAFASKKAQVEQAARGYKDLNMRALRKINSGGILATFSCSHHISPTLFRQIVYAAVTDSGRQAQVIAQTAHPADHPTDVCHREGEYLKGLFLRVID
ncbi:MAG: class I SAM-dependent rRNA methyltransferase [Candidatus Latescibacter sp.]|nr:class I SAM-dependent rRNA methyltransferase [Candidatus Latescibacter sp.]